MVRNVRCTTAVLPCASPVPPLLLGLDAQALAPLLICQYFQP